MYSGLRLHTEQYLTKNMASPSAFLSPSLGWRIAAMMQGVFDSEQPLFMLFYGSERCSLGPVIFGGSPCRSFSWRMWMGWDFDPLSLCEFSTGTVWPEYLLSVVATHITVPATSFLSETKVSPRSRLCQCPVFGNGQRLMPREEDKNRASV